MELRVRIEEYKNSVVCVKSNDGLQGVYLAESTVKTLLQLENAISTSVMQLPSKLRSWRLPQSRNIS